jgi:hypothetical protein
MDFAVPRSTPMSDRFANSGPNTVSDAVELALYSIAVLFIVLLWVYVPAQRFPDRPDVRPVG